MEYRYHLRVWFWGAQWKNITRKAMSAWLAWSIFDREFEDLGSAEDAFVAEALSLMEKRTGGRLADKRPDGKPDIVPMKLTLVKVNIWSRPALAYMVPELANIATRAWLEYMHGMRLCYHEGIECVLLAF